MQMTFFSIIDNLVMLLLLKLPRYVVGENTTQLSGL